MVLILDDENYLRELVERAFPDEEIVQYYDSLSFFEAARKEKPDLLVIDLRIEHRKGVPPENYFSSNPGLEGLRVLEKVRKSGLQIPVVLATRFAVSEIFMRTYAMNAIPLEITDVPTAVKSLREKVGHFLEKKSNTICQSYRKLGYIAHDPKSVEILKIAEKLRNMDDAILITGETGVGKDTLARAIHMRSNRAKKPFINFIISAYPKNLLYAKLFGTVKGAFTGASDQPGSFEEVEEGTLVLNEIGDLDLESQIQLLQVLESRTFSRLGEHKKRVFKGRIIAVTNRDLTGLIQQGKFREDLYNRMRKFQIHVPPLRERREDILEFISYYMPDIRLSSSAENFLTHEFQFPGNLRTLRFILDRVKNLSPAYPRVSLDDIIASILDLKKLNGEEQSHASPVSPAAVMEYLIQNQVSLQEFQEKIFQEGLNRLGRHWSPDTWGKLGISRATFYRKVRGTSDVQN